MANQSHIASTKRGRPGYEREELLSICVRAFNEYGYEATSMGVLADALGITKSAIYHHVKSKEEILEYALNRALVSLEEVFDAAESLEDSNPAEAVEFVTRQTVYALVEQFDNVTLLLRLRGNSQVETEALERRRELTSRLSALVKTAQEAKEIRQDISDRTIARLIFGMINSLATWYRPERGENVEKLADAVVQMAFDGMADSTATSATAR
ncbi:TetR/AcrR family transcriptional regulator [Rothia sp. ND6WE1A]|uniref:TetR/AcrR family transcriptional regulator n=1 Tax=Rothia sp. ND6WE1A TaxID=1848190 RepID=UPI000835D72F|nr:TetR/AcrR family transcriptional regulator [Rothia sp. ND6WE1A]